MQKQEIVRKDKNGNVLNVGDVVQVAAYGISGEGVVVEQPTSLNLQGYGAEIIWVNLLTKEPTCSGPETLGWYPPALTLIKRKAQPHVNAELIKAWADDPAGVVIQYHNGVHWVDTLNNNPSWGTKTQYRIKHNTQKVKKYNFSYRNKFGIIQTSVQRFTEEDFKKQFVDGGDCTEYVRLDFSMQEVEIEV